MTKLKEYQERLLSAASKALKGAYVPYSRFFVGSALLTAEGRIITGSNFENASYGLTICAERTAIVTANNLGHRKIKAIAVIAEPEGMRVKEPFTSCGACRQFIAESARISGIDIELIFATPDRSKVVVTRISRLLPMEFHI